MAETVTVLVADVSGLASDSSKNALWVRLGTAITAFGGNLETGDDSKIMQAHFDLPEDAVRSALAMQAELRAVQHESPHPSQPLGELSVGINTGPNEANLTLQTPIRQTDESAIALAAFLQKQAMVDGGNILISHSTYRHVRGIFDMQVLPTSTTVRSPFYIVRQAKPRPFHLSTRSVSGTETQMVGRSTELGILTDALSRVIQHQHTQAVTIIGESGIGKSRLLYEFQNYLDLQDTDVWLFRARTPPAVYTLPYALIRDVFIFRAEILSSDPIGIAREKLVQMIQTFIPGLKGEEHAHLIGHFFGFNFAYSSYLRALSWRQIQQKATQSILNVLRAASHTDPVVIFLEDIHWADNASLDLIELMVSECYDIPLLLVAIAKPLLMERRPTWGEISNHQHLHLGPLSPNESRQLIGEICRRGSQLPADMVDHIMTCSGGKPLAIEEATLLVKAGGAVPEPCAGLEDILRIRLATLSQAERRILNKAAVLGQQFWDRALAAIDYPTPDDLPTVQSLLQDLQAKDYIVRVDSTSFATTHEYQFRHIALRNLIYQDLGDAKRYHGPAASWLVTHSAQRVREYAALLAHHYEEAGEQAQAAEYLIRAGKQSAGVGAFSEARVFFEHALIVLDESESASRRMTLLHWLGDALRNLDHFSEAHAILIESLNLAETTGDRKLVADNLRLMGWVARGQSDAGAAWGHAIESLNVAREIGDRDGIAHSQHLLGRLALEVGRLDDAQRYLEACLNVFRSLSYQYETAETITGLAEVNYQRRHFREAFILGQVALTMALSLDVVNLMQRLVAFFVSLMLEEDNPTYAARWLGAVLPPPAALESTVEALRQRLDDEPQPIELRAVVQDILSKDRD